MMDLQEIFKLTGLKGIISIDDAWNYSKNVEAVLFDLYRVPLIDSELFLQCVELKDSAIRQKFEAALTKLHDENFDIKDKAIGIIKRHVSEEAKKLIENITTDDIECIEGIIKEYGLSIDECGIRKAKLVAKNFLKKHIYVAFTELC